ncbi:MAG: hypothetical protein V7K89_27325 [Nostoc sp.]|uniref:hypothetical protein n=1 Tax=Nostoc sp. TaxID=1180 RepID=UPI002FF48E85
MLEVGGRTITIPSIHACHYVLTYVTTAIPFFHPSRTHRPSTAFVTLGESNR